MNYFLFISPSFLPLRKKQNHCCHRLASLYHLLLWCGHSLSSSMIKYRFWSSHGAMVGTSPTIYEYGSCGLWGRGNDVWNFVFRLTFLPCGCSSLKYYVLGNRVIDEWKNILNWQNIRGPRMFLSFLSFCVIKIIIS